jgi:hypothetical protein
MPGRFLPHIGSPAKPCLSPRQPNRLARGLPLAAFLVVVTLFCRPAFALPPANDLCSGAEFIPGNGPFPYWSSITPDVSGATTAGDPPAPSCAASGVSRSIWYRFTPAVGGLYTLSVSDDTATTVPDTVMAVYTTANGCTGPFSQVACDDDQGGLKSAISTTLTAGTNYYIVVWVSDYSAPLTNGHGAVQLKVSHPVAPPNDNCSGAEIIPGSGPFPYLTASTDNSLATSAGDPPAPACQTNFSRSVWYQFTPAATSTYTLSTCADTATTVYDTLMAVYTSPNGCGGPFSQVACNDDSCDYRSAITTALNSGTTYYIVVWEAGNDPYTPGETTVQLRVSGFFAPAVTTLPATSITSTGALLHATVNPNGVATTAWFDWGTTTNYANSTPPQLLGSGASGIDLTATPNGPISNRTCYFRARATNVLGSTFGTNLNFAWVSARPAIKAPAHAANGAFNFQFTGAPGQLYLIQSSTNLVNWAGIGTATDSGNGSFLFQDANPANLPFRFYRILAP